MKKLFTLGLLICSLTAFTGYGQKKGKKGRSAYKMEVVTIPESISASFGTLKKIGLYFAIRLSLQVKKYLW